MLQVLEDDKKAGVILYDTDTKEREYIFYYQLFFLARNYSIEGLSLSNNMYIILESNEFCIKSGYSTIFLDYNRMTNNMLAYVIEDKGSLNITVQFEDGYIKTNSTRTKFKNGYIANPSIPISSYKTGVKSSIVGEKAKMNCGLVCTVIEDNGASDITVLFENGDIVKHRNRTHFRNKSILPDSYKNTSILGQSLKMNCGLVCTVIEDISSNNITVQFEDNYIVRNRTRQEFKQRHIARTYHSMESQKKSLLGIKKLLNNGLWCEVVKYNNAHDMSIRFDIDNSIKHTSRSCFLAGYIGHRDYSIHSKTSVRGRTLLMTCGLYATCIEDNRVDDITVLFEDGVVVDKRHRYEFINRHICHPSIRPKIYNSIVGQSKRMHNGLNCVVIEDNGYNDIVVEFDDKYKVSTNRGCFAQGYIRHPDYTLGSYPELVLWRYIKSFFPDAIHNFRPDWLCNKLTGRNLELDIYIPSLKIGIEYDSFTYHKDYTFLSDLKHDLISNTTNVDKLYTLLEPGACVYDNEKFINIRMQVENNRGSFLEFGLLPAISILLKYLGSNKNISLSDKEWCRDVTT